MARIGKSDEIGEAVQTEDKFTLEYQDFPPIFIPRLTYYSDGVSLSKPGVRIMVTEKEKNRLLKHMNGNKPKFVEV